MTKTSTKSKINEQQGHDYVSLKRIAGITAWIIGTILLAIPAFYGYKSWATSKKSQDDTIKQGVSEIAPNIDIEKPKILKGGNQEYTVINNDKDPIYTTGVGNRILTNFIATDGSGVILPAIIPEKISSSGIISVNTSNANGKVTLKAICQDNGNIELDNGEKAPCIPKGINIVQTNDTPTYKGIRILGIDATFADDNIGLETIRDFFDSKGAVFYSAQSNGISKDDRGIRIDNPQLFPKQKKLFIFYNDANFPTEDVTKSLVKDFIQEDIASHFTHLDDVQFYSFTSLWKDLDIKTERNDIRTIMYWIGDCGELERCPNVILEKNKQQIFSKNMLRKNELDFFFIVTATMETKREVKK